MAGKLWKRKQAEAQEERETESAGAERAGAERAGSEGTGAERAEAERPGEGGAMRVRICGRENGLEIYEDVSFVRVWSKKYNLLIMKDYLPILGRVEGSIAFRTAREELERTNIQGFFMHKNNVFSLMLEDVYPAEETAQEGGRPEKETWEDE